MQIRSTQRQVALLPELTPPESQHDVLPDTIPVTFSTFLRSGNTTDAFKVWSRHAETLLFQVANSQHHQTKPSNIHRGEVKFHDTQKFPRVIDGQATILKDRQLWKAMCRAIECQKAAPGYRRDKTWKKLFDIILHLPHQYQHEFKCLAAQPVSLELAKRVETLLQNIYKTQCKENSSQRILNWKKRMRSDDSEATKWLRTKTKKKILAISSTEEGPFANSQSRMEAIRDAWSKIFWAHKNGEPSLRQFLTKFGPSLKRATIALPELQQEDLIQQVFKTKPSPPGMDKWSYQELQDLARWCPSMFKHLTDLLQCIENGCSWPDPIKIGMGSFIPKDVDGDCPTPLQHRPITVLSCIRLWSAVRHSHLAEA